MTDDLIARQIARVRDGGYKHADVMAIADALEALREQAERLYDAAENVIAKRGTNASRSILIRRLAEYDAAFPETAP